MNSYAVAEKFVSINGEGKHAGELAVFLRFRGCNLACGFCDTKWANTAAAPAVRMTTDELVAYVRETGVRNVTLTGGEPLLQPGIDELITALGALGYRVEIETNGSVSLQPFASLSFRPCFTMDYKLPGSGMEQTMLPENFSLLRSRDAVKFVAGSRADLERGAGNILEIWSDRPLYRVFQPGIRLDRTGGDRGIPKRTYAEWSTAAAAAA